jgi:hypothetical protein
VWLFELCIVAARGEQDWPAELGEMFGRAHRVVFAGGEDDLAATAASTPETSGAPTPNAALSSVSRHPAGEQGDCAGQRRREAV